MNVLAQQENIGGLAGLLESTPTDAIMVMFVVFTVFSTLLLIAITFFVTHTIRSIKISAINANLTERLVKEGVPHEQIERLVRANNRRFPSIILPSKWKKAGNTAQQVPGKPHPIHS